MNLSTRITLEAPAATATFQYGAFTAATAELERLRNLETNRPNFAQDHTWEFIADLRQRAYQRLADSVNTSYSNAMGRVMDQAHAAGIQRFADELQAIVQYDADSATVTTWPARP